MTMASAAVIFFRGRTRSENELGTGESLNSLVTTVLRKVANLAGCFLAKDGMTTILAAGVSVRSLTGLLVPCCEHRDQMGRRFRRQQPDQRGQWS